MDGSDDSKALTAKTPVERFVARLRANPVVATLLVVAAIVAGVASFTDSATKLLALFSKPSPTAARASLGQMGLPFDADHFVASAGNGDLTAVKLYATAGMDLDASAADSTALASAAFHDRLPVMTFLLDAGAHIRVDGGERSALYSAVVGGHDDAVRLLLARKPDAATIDAAFVIAVKRRIGKSSRNLQAMRTLAANGADVRRVAPDAFLAVWANADDDDAAEVTTLLIELGVKLNDLEGTGGEVDRQTPLMEAASQGFTRTADVLLGAGAGVDTRYRHPDSDDDGATALMLAAGSGSTAIVRALLAKGASAATRDRHGQRAIDYAKRGSATNRDDVVRVLAAAK